MDLFNKNVIITGGNGCIGYEIVRNLLKNGTNKIGILSIDDNDKIIESLKSEFVDRTILFIETDVTNKSCVKKAYTDLISKFQFIDIVINSAGVINENYPENTVLVNLLGVINSTYEAMDHMSLTKNGRGGIVVNISSMLGLSYQPFCPVYTATKHGVKSFTKALGQELTLKKHGISFMTICPGITESSMLIGMEDRYYSDFAIDAANTVRRSNRQSCEEVGKLVLQVLVINKTGSIWIIEDGCLREYVPINEFK